MTPEFHPDARAELAAAVMSGASYGVTVGERLRVETMRVVYMLCDFPNIGEPLTPPYRKFPIENFPFSIIFRSDGDVLRIVAFAHKKKRPGYWRRRK
jgi:toxin ParE1/3/4